jgi:ammonium transporter, Amt family
LRVYIIFLILWSTFVYDIVAHWVWGPHGWLSSNFEILDYAGGMPVHIVAGFSSLAYALCVGPRRTVDLKKQKPSNISDVFFGASILWFGWFFFNGGSEMAINSRAVNASVITNLAGCTGGLTWICIEMIHYKTTKMSLNGLCAGVISGMVCITPGAGYIAPRFSLLFGLTGALVCYYGIQLKGYLNHKYDDALDVFASKISILVVLFSNQILICYCSSSWRWWDCKC